MKEHGYSRGVTRTHCIALHFTRAHTRSNGASLQSGASVPRQSNAPGRSGHAPSICGPVAESVGPRGLSCGRRRGSWPSNRPLFAVPGDPGERRKSESRRRDCGIRISTELSRATRKVAACAHLFPFSVFAAGGFLPREHASRWSVTQCAGACGEGRRQQGTGGTRAARLGARDEGGRTRRDLFLPARSRARRGQSHGPAVPHRRRTCLVAQAQSRVCPSSAGATRGVW